MLGEVVVQPQPVPSKAARAARVTEEEPKVNPNVCIIKRFERSTAECKHCFIRCPETPGWWRSGTYHFC